ncbi:MAG TPA: hypothetical protein VFM88_18835 [Vicinamibacteria bacterium]|nr:hypothetical protein [Vicinamibacteria bacterium]
MKTMPTALAVTYALAASAALAHDPRTAARELEQALVLEGLGRLELKYKAMHWNPTAYDRFQTDSAVRERVNTNVWSAIGTLTNGFDVTVGGLAVPKGSYPFGIRIEGADKFSLVLKLGAETKTIPFEVSTGGAPTEYLSFALFPTGRPDTFTLEGRCGSFRGISALTVPHLTGHDPEKPH